MDSPSEVAESLNAPCYCEELKLSMGMTETCQTCRIADVIRAAVAAENEACAVVADYHDERFVAEAIRARMS